MISKYTYKGLTWIDLESPTDEELSYVVDSKLNGALHFIIGEDTMITSRKYKTPQIATFAKNFERNVALDKPIQTDTIDALFFELLSFFKQNGEYAKILKDKNNEIYSIRSAHQKELKLYSRRVLVLQCSIILISLIILFTYLWL